MYRDDGKNSDPMVETYWTLAMAVTWIATRSPVEVVRARGARLADLPSSPDIASAMAELWDRLAIGALTAIAEGDHLNPVITIPENEWGYLRPAPRSLLPGQNDELRFKNFIRGYRDIKVQRIHVVDLWGAKPATIRLADAQRCQEWLTEIMHASPHAQTRSQSELLCEAKQSRNLKISQREFKRAWSDAAKSADAPAWVSGGRPKKSPQKNPDTE